MSDYWLKKLKDLINEQKSDKTDLAMTNWKQVEDDQQEPGVSKQDPHKPLRQKTVSPLKWFYSPAVKSVINN